MPLSSQAVLEKWGLITAVGPETDQRPFHFWALLQTVWGVVRLFPNLSARKWSDRGHPRFPGARKWVAPSARNPLHLSLVRRGRGEGRGNRSGSGSGSRSRLESCPTEGTDAADRRARA